MRIRLFHILSLPEPRRVVMHNFSPPAYTYPGLRVTQHRTSNLYGREKKRTKPQDGRGGHAAQGKARAHTGRMGLTQQKGRWNSARPHPQAVPPPYSVLRTVIPDASIYNGWCAPASIHPNPRSPVEDGGHDLCCPYR